MLGSFVSHLYALAIFSSVTVCTPIALPEVHTPNGTYLGIHLAAYSQDVFLGIPYAQAPVEGLRLQRPQSLNETWHGTRKAFAYGKACYGYGPDTYIGDKNDVSEDCLTLNVVRPSGYRNEELPVAVWIYGGGFYEGASSDPRYNLSFIVNQSTAIGKPIMAVSFNYRLHGFGWLWSKDIVEAGVANLGLYDQRLALHWLNENIGAFGGAKDKVTIWGESAGALSVGLHLLAYNGRDDGLFSGAIAESGAPTGLGVGNTDPYRAEDIYARIVKEVGCSNTDDKLKCIRKVPVQKLNQSFTGIVGETYRQINFGPLIDHDIIQRDATQQMISGDFVKVPFVLGENSADGTDFPPLGINTDAQFRKFFSRFGWDRTTELQIEQLYPLNKADYIPQSTVDGFNAIIGHQFRRAATLIGDLFFKAPRRLAAHTWVDHTTVPLYSYRFDATSNSDAKYQGSTHWTEVPFVFHNTIDGGQGFSGEEILPYFGRKPFVGEFAGQAYLDLADYMSRTWATFIHDRNPNYDIEGAVTWPAYSAESPTNLVFNVQNRSYIESDTYRSRQIGFLIDKYQEGRGVWSKHDMT